MEGAVPHTCPEGKGMGSAVPPPPTHVGVYHLQLNLHQLLQGFFKNAPPRPSAGTALPGCRGEQQGNDSLGVECRAHSYFEGTAQATSRQNVDSFPPASPQALAMEAACQPWLETCTRPSLQVMETPRIPPATSHPDPTSSFHSVRTQPYLGSS